MYDDIRKTLIETKARETEVQKAIAAAVLAHLQSTHGVIERDKMVRNPNLLVLLEEIWQTWRLKQEHPGVYHSDNRKTPEHFVAEPFNLTLPSNSKPLIDLQPSKIPSKLIHHIANRYFTRSSRSIDGRGLAPGTSGYDNFFTISLRTKPEREPTDLGSTTLETEHGIILKFWAEQYKAAVTVQSSRERDPIGVANSWEELRILLVHENEKTGFRFYPDPFISMDY